MSITFQRVLSPFLVSFFDEKASLDARAYNSEIAVEITLKNLSVLRYATSNIVIDSLSRNGASVGVAPISFSSRLEGAPDFRIGQTRAPDVSNIEVVNLDYLLSSAIPDNARVYDNARVKAYLAFRKSGGSYEAIEFFEGQLTNLQGDDEKASISSTADLSAKAALAGREIPQRCVNELGDAWCGVPPSTLPVGAVCSKIHNDSESGCIFWGGVYNGIPFIDPSSIVGGYSGQPTGGGGGWEEPPHHCPDVETTWFESANGGYISGRDLRQGEVIIAATGEPAIVENVERVYSEYRYLTRTRFNANLIVSAKHRFLRGATDPTGAPAVSWKFPEWGLFCKTPKGNVIAEPTEDPKTYRENYSFKPIHGGYVLVMTLSEPKTYWAGMEQGFMLGSHNTKYEPYIVVY